MLGWIIFAFSAGMIISIIVERYIQKRLRRILINRLIIDLEKASKGLVKEVYNAAWHDSFVYGKIMDEGYLRDSVYNAWLTIDDEDRITLRLHGNFGDSDEIRSRVVCQRFVTFSRAMAKVTNTKAKNYSIQDDLPVTSELKEIKKDLS